MRDANKWIPGLQSTEAFKVSEILGTSFDSQEDLNEFLSCRCFPETDVWLVEYASGEFALLCDHFMRFKNGSHLKFETFILNDIFSTSQITEVTLLGFVPQSVLGGNESIPAEKALREVASQLWTRHTLHKVHSQTSDFCVPGETIAPSFLMKPENFDQEALRAALTASKPDVISFRRQSAQSTPLKCDAFLQTHLPRHYGERHLHLPEA